VCKNQNNADMYFVSNANIKPMGVVMNSRGWTIYSNQFYKVSKWPKSRVRNALMFFSFGRKKSSRRAKKDYKILSELPRFRINELQVKRMSKYLIGV